VNLLTFVVLWWLVATVGASVMALVVMVSRNPELFPQTASALCVLSLSNAMMLIVIGDHIRSRPE
jgi:hypothetical protein